MQKEVEGERESIDDDDGPQDAVADAAAVARSGVSADSAGNHHVPAVAPGDGGVDDKSDDCDAVGNSCGDDLKRVDFGNVLDSAEGEGGHEEESGSGSEVADVKA